MFAINWSSWVRALVPGVKRRPHTPAKRSSFRPQVEGLENRWVPSATASVGGSAFLDLTGNGAAAANPGQSGVTIQLFQDSNHDGKLDAGDRFVASQKSAASGSYGFTNLRPGTYFVNEVVPAGYVVTAPFSGSTYTVTLADGQAVSGDDFTNFQKPNTSAITNISYRITDPVLGVYTVTNLRGQAHQGDTVTVNFTVTAGNTATVSLISYDAPGAAFSAANASQQTIADMQTGTFTAGPHSLTVQIPSDFYQIDFVAGSAITTFGPAGSNMFYSAQGRLLSADNGGTQLFAASSLSGHAYVDANANGTLDAGETPLGQVTVTLTGINDLGQSVSMSTTTDSTGLYSFTGLRQGTYSITDVPAAGFTDELSTTAGSLGGSLTTAGQVSNIVVSNGQNGINYDLPEVAKVVAPTYSISGTLHFFPNEPATSIVLTDTTTGVSQTIILTGTSPYSFTGLTAGDNFTVTVVPPTGFAAETSATVKSTYTITNLSSDVTGDNFFIAKPAG